MACVEPYSSTAWAEVAMIAAAIALDEVKVMVPSVAAFPAEDCLRSTVDLWAAEDFVEIR